VGGDIVSYKKTFLLLAQAQATPKVPCWPGIGQPVADADASAGCAHHLR
jgi:hypothetical protein